MMQNNEGGMSGLPETSSVCYFLFTSCASECQTAESADVCGKVYFIRRAQSPSSDAWGSEISCVSSAIIYFTGVWERAWVLKAVLGGPRVAIHIVRH